MQKPTPQLLTYLAQVRQLHFKNDKPLLHHAYIMLPFLHIKRSKNVGISRKGIVIIGIVRDAVWAEPNKSTGVWLKVAGNLVLSSLYFLSQSHAKGRR